MVVDHERLCMHDFEKNHYVYITVDQGWVEPATSQRRSGPHGDSYRRINTKNTSPVILVDHVYIAYDDCPTLFFEGPFSLDSIDPENIADVLELFKKNAEQKKPIFYPAYTVLRIDPYCVHDAGINTSDKPIYRTFVKISFSKLKYAHLGNAFNNLFMYDWPLTPRLVVPYTKEAIVLSAHRSDRDQFIEIDSHEIDFIHKKSCVPWAESHVYTIVRTGEVYAEPAQAGDLVEARSDDFLITVDVAQEGDYKVVFSHNNCGFMSAQKLYAMYSPDLNNNNWYHRKKMICRAVRLTKPVRMQASWGTLHYADAGDYLVYINEDDTYFVPKKLFEETSEILD